tara:strand:- start:1142 stop:1936 length:795 start_codon:yes stop_codon:yes gene_type:complete
MDMKKTKKVNNESFEGIIPEGCTVSDLSERQYIESSALKVYENNPNIVARLESKEGSFIVKLFGWRHRFHYFLSPAMDSRAYKSWKTAQAIRRAGGRSPKPLFVFTGRKCGFITDNYYISEDINPHLSFRNFLRNSPNEDSATQAVSDLACCIARIHKGGVYHRDLTPGNILVDENNNCHIVDLNRARLLKRLTVRQRSQDLAKLNFDQSGPEMETILLKQFFSEYGRHSGMGIDWLTKYNEYRQRLLRFRSNKAALRKWLGKK